jgi:hypothetical protein
MLLFKILNVIVMFLMPVMAFSVDRITSPLILKDSLKTFNKLEFGIRAVATDTVDLELGENYDLPGPPPGGLHGYFRIFNPVRNETTSSYLDYRAIPEIHGKPVVFTLHTFYIVEYLQFQWQPFEKQYVDSAFIEDVYGAGIKFDMIEQSEGRVDNPSITKYNITIWFSDKVADVAETKEDVLNVYPNPSDDVFVVESHFIGSEYKIYNSQMMMVNKGIIISDRFELDLSELNKGVYYFIIDHYGKKYLQKLILIGS